MDCGYYERGQCRSCTLIETPYDQQLAEKQAAVRTLLGDHQRLRWLEPVASEEAGFRNKAKMAVAGRVGAPTFGILDREGRGTDLVGCPLYPAHVTEALAGVARFVGDVRLLPYDVAKRRGELKNVLVTGTPAGRVMIRFVLRSTAQVGKIRDNLSQLLNLVPHADVVSVNLQPEHKAVLEGPEEIVLTDAAHVTMTVNDIPLRLGTCSFFQTNTDVTSRLYRQVSAWVDACAPRTVWDLYCGVGGFALHVAGQGREVEGLEISPEAVASARRTASDLGLPAFGPGSVRFLADDAAVTPALFAGRTGGSVEDDDQAGAGAGTGGGAGGVGGPDLVIVNPPRRGLDASLCEWLETSDVRDVVYSSCNAKTLARDLARMPSLEPVEAQLLDMFPHTGHYEVAVLLRRG